MYTDRIEAGMILAEELEKYKNEDAVIMAVPRGGVPVAYPIARQLGFPLDLVLIKKLGHPLHKEYAIGAVNLSDIILEPHEDVPASYIEEETIRIRKRLQKMYQHFKGNKPSEKITGKTVIIVDDGIATGRTLASAVDLIKKSNPAKIVIAVPVASKKAIKNLSTHVDEIICPLVPEEFYGVGRFYEDFTQSNDEEVLDYLLRL
jgi:putative phosphoribosyl transferase